jgi:hypothetical protein
MSSPEIFPQPPTEGYAVYASRPDGERVLGVIAAKSTREYVWIFKEGDQIWENHRVKPLEKKKYRRGVLQSHTMGAKIPRKLNWASLPVFGLA